VLPTGIYLPNLKILVSVKSAWYTNFGFGIYGKFGTSLVGIFLTQGLVSVLPQNGANC